MTSRTAAESFAPVRTGRLRGNDFGGMLEVEREDGLRVGVAGGNLAGGR